MEIAFILVYGSLLGLMAPYIISGNENYGVLLPPALALIYGYFVWAVFTWVGLSYNEFWIWAITMLGMPCLLYTSPSPRDRTRSRMPSSA